MTFRFTTGGRPQQTVVDMTLEAEFEGGKIVQSMFVYARRGQTISRDLLYREGTTGRWLSSEGISFNGLSRTPENLVRSVGNAEPARETYVLPAT